MTELAETLDRRAEIEQRLANAFPGEEKERDRFMALAMFNGYARNWHDDRPELVEAVEMEFTGPIENPATGRASRTFVLRGKGDLLWRDVNGKLWYVEHKTASDLPGSYLERLPMDLQINLYLPYLEAAIGEPIAGVVYDVLLKTRIRQKKTESSSEFYNRLMDTYESSEMFHREPVLLSGDDILSTFADVWEIARRIRDAHQSGVWHRNTGACFDYYRPCAYYNLCRVPVGQRQSLIDNFYKFKKAHSELSPLDINGGKRVLTYSSIKTFCACPRKYDWRFNCQIVPEKHDATALYFGSAIHAALAAHFGSEDVATYFKQGE